MKLTHLSERSFLKTPKKDQFFLKEQILNVRNDRMLDFLSFLNKKVLMKKVAEKEPHKAFDYLREVYDFAIFMSKYNKVKNLFTYGFI